MYKRRPSRLENKDATLTSGARTRIPLKKRLTQSFADYKWWLTALIWVVALVLGYIGFAKYFSAIGAVTSFWDIFYRDLQLLKLGFVELPGALNAELQVARYLVPAVGLYTAAQTLVDILHDQIQLFCVRFMKDHVVICGLGQKGLLLSDRYRELGEQLIVIEKDEKNVMIGHCKERGTVVLTGNAADPQLLRKAQAHKAKYVISVCGNDGTNAEVAVNVRQLARGRKGRALSCLVHIVDLQLWRLLREHEIRMGRLNAFRLGFFNVYETGARALLYECSSFSNEEVRESRPHILVVGVGRMGESLVINAAKRWRDSENINVGRLRITMIDKKAQSKKESLCLRYPQLEKVCELLPIEIDVDSPEFERAAFLFDSHGRSDVSTIFICLGEDLVALTAALKLYQRIRPLEIMTIVRMNVDAGLATLLQGDQDRHESLRNVQAFALLEHTCTPDLIWGGCINEILARAIHEDYLRNERRKGETPKTNPSMVPWEDLPEGLRESNRSQAEHIRVKLEVIDCDLFMTTDWDVPLFEFSQEEVERLAKLEHERFVEERLRAGWKFGIIKDLEKKTNPTLIPWNELSGREKDKDIDAVRGIPAFLARAGFQVYRSKKLE
ncbi:MAG: NAD-binding protein [Candidatus Bathyarchaeota archaeon]|nr:NAD-binding protein [Candidatus Bathyarchaeota archaeon]